jgi:hypothetical protein
MLIIHMHAVSSTPRIYGYNTWKCELRYITYGEPRKDTDAYFLGYTTCFISTVTFTHDYY